MLSATIHDAVKEGSFNDVVTFIETPGAINARQNELTPLYLAVDYNRAEIFDHLLAKPDLEIEAVNSPGGLTALHLAAMLFRADMVVKLLKKGANPNALDGDGNNPLHYLGDGIGSEEEASRSRIITELLLAGTDQLHVNSAGNMPLGNRSSANGVWAYALTFVGSTSEAESPAGIAPGASDP